MLFEARFWPLVADGTVTLTFRRWKRRQAVAGHTYRTPQARILVDSVEVIDPGQITDADAQRSGYPTADAVRAALRGDHDLPVYRIAFHAVDEPDPRATLASDGQLSDDDVAELDRRLDRLDQASRHGPWTRAMLGAIAERPAVRAADLAADAGRERLEYKADVRKLKNLGLTISLERGYRLSPRGEAYLRRAATR